MGSWFNCLNRTWLVRTQRSDEKISKKCTSQELIAYKSGLMDLAQKRKIIWNKSEEKMEKMSFSEEELLRAVQEEMNLSVSDSEKHYENPTNPPTLVNFLVDKVLVYSMAMAVTHS